MFGVDRVSCITVTVETGITLPNILCENTRCELM